MLIFKRFSTCRFLLIAALAMSSGCANKVLNYDKADHLQKMDEFEQQVKIGNPEPVIAEQGSLQTTPQPKKIRKPKKRKALKEKVDAQVKDPSLHEPADVEGTVGFIGRRPLKDPFRVGEKIVHEVTYFGLSAGNLSLEVLPFTTVNGRKSYQFEMRIWTSPFFSKIYSVNDKVISLIDFDSLVPSVFTVHIKETKVLKEARAFFDREKNLANYWERKVVDGEAEAEKKLQWEMAEYSQNVFSAAYYMRAFQWDTGTENAFRVADDGQNLIFKAKAIRKEKIKTAVGEFNAIVIKPEVQLRGVAKPVGDIFVWISDDDRKYILRIESKIKIGTLVTEISELVPGSESQ